MSIKTITELEAFWNEFQSDYERENPATSKKGWERWLKFMNNEDKEEYMNQ